MTITIYHNPRCGTSRTTLALLREKGEDPVIIEYLKTPPTKDEFIKLVKDAGISVRDAIRTKEEVYKTLELDDPLWSDDQLVDFILENPILIQRPIVVTDKGTKICRPADLVLQLL